MDGYRLYMASVALSNSLPLFPPLFPPPLSNSLQLSPPCIADYRFVVHECANRNRSTSRLPILPADEEGEEGEADDDDEGGDEDSEDDKGDGHDDDQG